MGQKVGNIIRCGFCKKEFNRWRTNSKGDKKHGYENLRDHCIENHSDEPAVKELILNMEEEEYGDIQLRY